MITECALLDVRRPTSKARFAKRGRSSPSNLALSRCGWNGVWFRRSPQYEQWRALLHHFYEPFPTVEHFEAVER